MSKVENISISFVVLHYNNWNETKNCIQSLKKYLNNKTVHIIVVDNGSTKEKLNKISRENNNPFIHYIISSKNLGFARGNNLGFKYAKYTLNSSIIILTNNDTWFKQKDFIDKLELHYLEGFDVAGPKILTQNGTINQNPIFKVYDDPSKVKKLILKFKFLLFLWNFNLDNFFMKKIVPLVRKNKNEVLNSDNFKLHGACLIFAHNYIKRFDGLSSDTFMYGEEDYLKYITKINKLRLKYFKDLVVYHKGNASTDKEYGLGRMKRKFYYTWSLDSFRKLEVYMKQHGENK